MADAASPELAGKGKRVAGVFIFMIGASIILDTHALWIGVPLLGVATVVFGRGMAEGRTSEPLAAPVRDPSTETQS